MAKAGLGTKRVCPHCGARYYDMKKTPPVCPNCKTAFDPEALVKTRRGRATEVKKVAAVPEEVIEDLPLDDESDTGLIEDADELADDDVDEVVDIGDDEKDSRS